MKTCFILLILNHKKDIPVIHIQWIFDSRYVEEYPETSTEYTTLYPTVAYNAQSNIVIANQTAPSPVTSLPVQSATSTEKKSEKRKDGVIFPSIKNKPGPANTTFATELLDLSKDVKVRNFHSEKLLL